VHYQLDSTVLPKKELCFYEIQTSNGYMEEYGFLNLGILYGLEKKTLIARKKLLNAKKLAPDNELVLTLLSVLDSDKKNIDSVETDNKSFCNCYIKALKCFTFKEYDESLLYLHDLNRQNPDYPYFNYLLAEIYFAKEDYKKVINISKQLIRYDRADQYLYSLMIRSYINLDDMKNAKKINSLMLKKYPKSALFYIHLALINKKQGDYNTAITKVTEAQSIDPDLSESYSILGTLLLLKGKKDEAYTNFVKASSINPICVMSNVALWSQHYVKHLFNSSDKYEFNLRHSRFFNHKCYADWGEACIESKNYDLGLPAFYKALQLDKKNDDFMTKISYIHYQKRDLENAKAYVEDALMINNENKQAKKLKTMITYFQGTKFIVWQLVVALVLLLLNFFVLHHLMAELSFVPYHLFY